MSHQSLLKNQSKLYNTTVKSKIKMIFTVCFLILSLSTMTEGIIPNQNCFQAAKNAICYQYYPLQFQSCKDRILPYYDHVSFLKTILTEYYFAHFLSFISLFEVIWPSDLKICSIWKKCVYCTTAKLISRQPSILDGYRGI